MTKWQVQWKWRRRWDLSWALQNDIEFGKMGVGRERKYLSRTVQHTCDAEINEMIYSGWLKIILSMWWELITVEAGWRRYWGFLILLFIVLYILGIIFLVKRLKYKNGTERYQVGLPGMKGLFKGIVGNDVGKTVGDQIWWERAFMTIHCRVWVSANKH